MNVGETINRLRTEKHMSQGDLADALEVSRQSISKWETGASVPELDKLVKLSELFGVTLDELVTGKAPEQIGAPQGEQVPPQTMAVRPGTPPRKVAAVVLLSLSFAFVVLFTVVWRPLEGLILCLPLLACGLICLWAKKHPGLWCLWALFLMADLYLRYATGLSWAQVRFTFLWEPSWNYTRLAVAWCQCLGGLGLLVGTVFRLRKENLEWDRRNKLRFGAGCALFALLCLPWSAWIFLAGGLPLSGVVTLEAWLQDSLRLALLAALGVMLLRGRRRSTPPEQE